MTDQARADAIVITGVGMASSLGLDAATACAAYRAGLSGASQLDGQYVFNEEQNEFNNVIGHKIPIVLNGFEGYARILCIGWYALQDLLASIGVRSINPAKVGLYVALPVVWSDLKEIIVQQELQRDFRDDHGSSGIDQVSTDPLLLELRLCAKLLELVQLQIPKQHWQTFESGHAGFAIALGAAMEDLRSGHFAQCIVAGLDSFIDSTALQWLSDNGLLKTEQNPVGLQPGEAGAVICLETYSTARLRNANILAEVVAFAVGHEVDSYFSERQSVGKELASTMTQLLNLIPDGKLGRRWVVTDQTGESHRASEWGHALVRLAAAHCGFKDITTSYPASSFGDTGAASGGVSICSAVTALSRGYAIADYVICTSSSYDECRTAVLITNGRRKKNDSTTTGNAHSENV